MYYVCHSFLWCTLAPGSMAESPVYGAMSTEYSRAEMSCWGPDHPWGNRRNCMQRDVNRLIASSSAAAETSLSALLAYHSEIEAFQNVV